MSLILPLRFAPSTEVACYQDLANYTTVAADINVPRRNAISFMLDPEGFRYHIGKVAAGGVVAVSEGFQFLNGGSPNPYELLPTRSFQDVLKALPTETTPAANLANITPIAMNAGGAVVIRSGGDKALVFGSMSSYPVATRTAVAELNLTVPYSLNNNDTNTYSANFVRRTSLQPIMGFEIFPRAASVKPDGTRVILDGGSNVLYQLDFGTPWNTSTLSYSGVSYSTGTNVRERMFIPPSGCDIYSHQTSNHQIYRIAMPTRWDLASMTGTPTAPDEIKSVFPQTGANPLIIGIHVTNDRLFLALRRSGAGSTVDMQLVQYNAP